MAPVGADAVKIALSRGGAFKTMSGMERNPADRFRLLGAAILAGAMALFSARAAAHTLPVSHVLLVADKDYIHLELSFNPFELANFSQTDTNRNGRPDLLELPPEADRLAGRILAHLALRADGIPLAAETSGIFPDTGTHHATLRAHYRVDASRAAITLESSLQDIMGGSHLSQVSFLRAGKRELAQLDSQSRKATFAAPVRADRDPAAAERGRPGCPANSRRAVAALGASFAFVVVVAFRLRRRKAAPAISRNSSLPNQPPTP
jgi:hypothetical protein